MMTNIYETPGSHEKSKRKLIKKSFFNLNLKKSLELDNECEINNVKMFMNANVNNKIDHIRNENQNDSMKKNKNSINIRSSIQMNRIKRYYRFKCIKTYPKKVVICREYNNNNFINLLNLKNESMIEYEFSNNSNLDIDVKHKLNLEYMNFLNLNFTFNHLEWSNLGFLALASLSSIFILIDDETSLHHGKLSKVFSIDNLKTDNNSKLSDYNPFIDVTNSFNNKNNFSFNDYIENCNDCISTNDSKDVFIKKIKFNSIGDMLLILLNDQSIHILNLNSQKTEQITLSKHSKIIDVSFSNLNSNNVNLLAFEINQTKILNYDFRQKGFTETKINGLFSCFKLSNDDSFLALGDINGNLHIKDKKYDKPIKIENRDSNNPISCISLKNDLIITSNSSEKINIISSSLLQNIKSLEFKDSKIEKAEILLDKSRVMITGMNNITIQDDFSYESFDPSNNSWKFSNKERKINNKPFVYSYDLNNQKIIEQFSFIPQKEDCEKSKLNEETQFNIEEYNINHKIETFNANFFKKENEDFIKHHKYYSLNNEFSFISNPYQYSNSLDRNSRNSINRDFNFHKNDEFKNSLNSSFSLKEKKLAVLSSRTNSFYLWNINESLKAL